MYAQQVFQIEELRDNIFRHLSKPSLAACTRVSRESLRTSIRFLYQTWDEDSEPANFWSLSAYTYRSDLYASAIENLFLSAHKPCHPDDFVLRDKIRQFPRLRSITFHLMCCSIGSTATIRIKAGQSTAKSSLLELSGVTVRDLEKLLAMNEPSSLMVKNHVLTRLDMNDELPCLYRSRSRDPPKAALLKRLASLLLPFRHSLDSLKLPPCSLYDLDLVKDLIEPLPRLDRLSITVTNGRETRPASHHRFSSRDTSGSIRSLSHSGKDWRDNWLVRSSPEDERSEDSRGRWASLISLATTDIKCLEVRAGSMIDVPANVLATLTATGKLLLIREG